jgi:LCP family protein required for cell wall assembly
VVLGALIMLGSGGAIVANKVIFAAATKSITQQNLLGNSGTQAQGHASITGAKNILLVGIDSRPGQAATDLVRSDSVMILHVPAGHDAAYLVSIPRDSYVAIPSFNNGKKTVGGMHDKINAAFAFGGQGLTGSAAKAKGVELLALTIKQDFSITPDSAAIVDFQGFQSVVDVLGGVDMYVDEQTTSIHIGYNNKTGKEQAPYTQDANLQLHKVSGVTPVTYHVGQQHLAAWQALDYVRQRDLLPDGDYGRQRHQQQFIKAVFKGILSSGVLSNPGKLASVLNVVGKAMTIDSGGVGIEDWIFAMRDISLDNLLTIKTNGGSFNSQSVAGLGSVEVINPTSIQLFQSIAADNVADFVVAHPDWVSNS